MRFIWKLAFRALHFYLMFYLAVEGKEFDVFTGRP